MSLNPSILFVGSIVLDSFIESQTQCPGGHSVISASVAAKFEIDASIVGKIGDDDHARMLTRFLESRRVDISKLSVLRSQSTKVASIDIDENGVWRHVSSEPERFPYITMPDLRLIAEYASDQSHTRRHIHIAGLNSLIAAVPKVAFALVNACRASGVSFSVGLSRFRAGDAELLNSLLHDSDLIFCSRAEFCNLHSQTNPESSAILQAVNTSRFTNLVVTLGPDGVFARFDGRPAIEQASEPTTAVNTLGAGDTFVGAFLAARMHDHSIQDAAFFATRAAALSIRYDHWDTWFSACTGFFDLERTAGPTADKQFV